MSEVTEMTDMAGTAPESLVDEDEVLAALGAATDRFVGLVGALGPDGDRMVGEGPWTAADTAAHVLTVLRRLLGDARRSDSPEATAGLNQACLDELEEREPAVLADLIATDAATILEEVVPLLPPDVDFPFHGGTTIRLVPGLCIVLGELLVHGHDIAQASGRAWEIDPGHAAVVVRGIVTVMPVWLDAREPGEATVVRLHDQRPDLRFELGGGQAAVGASFGAPDAETSVVDTDPVSFLLALYGRQAPSGGTLRRLTDRVLAI